MSISKPNLLLLSLCTAWGAAVTTGFGLLLRHAETPGISAVPTGFNATRPYLMESRQPFQLLMFIHPDCPCSAATIEELNRILTYTKNLMGVRIFIYQSASQKQPGRTGTLLRQLANIPNLEIETDRDALNAIRLGARTSGQVFLYHDDNLIFSGGITGSRGHAGDNDGAEAVVNFVLGKPAPPHTPVFGCQINPAINGEK